MLKFLKNILKGPDGLDSSKRAGGLFLILVAGATALVGVISIPSSAPAILAILSGAFIGLLTLTAVEKIKNKG